MAKEIPNINTNRLLLRNICEEDAEDIVKWRSDPRIYKYFISPHKITVQEHLNWYNNIYLNDSNRYDWMAVDYSGNNVGIFGIKRKNMNEDVAEISYILAPEKRGYGYAKEALVAIQNFLIEKWKCKFVIAEIHKNNIDSIKFAQKLGMKLISDKGKFVVYKNELVYDNKKNQKNKVFIRVDGNAYIGMGHIMRCLSIAEAIHEYGSDVVFITADESVSSIIKNKEFKQICLNSKWNDLSTEQNQICSLIKEQQVELLLVDSYYVTFEYLEKLKENTKVYYLDDLNTMEYPVNGIINYNIYGEETKYNNDMYEKIFLGPKYAPLRQEFINCSHRKFKQLKNVLITSGGTDNYNVVGNILDYMLSDETFSSLKYYCVLGRFNKNIDNMKYKYLNYCNVDILVDINNISDYMKCCDVAITAGGTTCYELCACGIPSIIYTLADNQFGIAESFSEKGIIPYVGDIRDNMEKCMSNIGVELNKLMNPECWNDKSAKMQQLVDGKGAKRLAKIMIDTLH